MLPQTCKEAGRRFAITSLVCLSLTGCTMLRTKPKEWANAVTATKNQPAPPPALEVNRSATVTSQKLELTIAMETAELARKRGMDEEAIAQYLTARRLDSKVKGVAHPLAVLYDRAGKMDAAEREYAIAMAEQGDNADLLCDYGYFLYSRGKHEEAETHLRAALKKQPKHQQAKVNLALVVGARGHYDESQQLFTEAIGPAAALHNIGMLKLRSGNQSGAIADLQAASSQDPSLAESRAVLAKLTSGLH